MLTYISSNDNIWQVCYVENDELLKSLRIFKNKTIKKIEGLITLKENSSKIKTSVEISELIENLDIVRSIFDG